MQDDKRRSLNLGASEEQASELCKLTSSACDDILSESDRVRLNSLLKQSDANREFYLRQIAVHSLLTTIAGNQVRQEILELQERVISEAEHALVSQRAALFRFPMSYLLRAAVLLFVLLTGVLFLTRFWSTPDQKPTTRVAVTQESELGITAEETLPTSINSQAPIAKVSRVSSDVRWVDSNDSFAIKSSVYAGNTISLNYGALELEYESGVSLLLMGPADFILSDRGGILRSGGLMATVPESGHGFTIDTPNGKVVDLGTKFGVVVDDFGFSEVSVFEGKVEAFPSGTTNKQIEKFELTKGRALQWNSDMVKSLEADLSRPPFSLTGFSASKESLSSREDNSRDALQVNSLDSKNWKALGKTYVEENQIILDGTDEQQVPYLISNQEFDPTLGPVTVVCDVRFTGVEPSAQPSFAILTRSAANRLDIDRPWKDFLSTCVRCNYRTSADLNDGLLETATKYEPDRELTTISWRGFRKPLGNTTYRLVMRDDGVNVSFEVFELDNPHVAKVVSCRSLFRGYNNFVALEGWKGGKIVVERVEISQTLPEAHLAAAPHVESDTTTPVETEALRSNQDWFTQQFVPEGAARVLQEDFEGRELDTQRWQVLGDVVLDHGSVSLGLPDKAPHIDTFHPRPYLLSIKKFDPAAQRIFVTGRIRFDENFLQGYGGSFAVLTRASDRYGVGPEWAVSALETGIRCNFWPASPRQEHILEIFEKTTPNSLTFLAGEDVSIHPESHDYYFCLSDDGEIASFTIQDASDPLICKTLSNPSAASELQEGLIGFESCWGSRVLLDDVEIFLQPNEATPEAD